MHTLLFMQAVTLTKARSLSLPLPLFTMQRVSGRRL